MACTFCATGTMGLKGDLSAGEILEQVLHASRVSPIRNVVFMGKDAHMHACLTRFTCVHTCGDKIFDRLSDSTSYEQQMVPAPLCSCFWVRGVLVLTQPRFVCARI